MTRQKRNSQVLSKAKRRQAGAQSISDKLVLSKSVTLQDYSLLISTVEAKLNAYNKTLADADAQQIEVDKAESLLSAYSEKMLLGIGAEYGKDSAEYERVGGVRKSDRKRPTRRIAAAV